MLIGTWHDRLREIVETESRSGQRHGQLRPERHRRDIMRLGKPKS